MKKLKVFVSMLCAGAVLAMPPVALVTAAGCSTSQQRKTVNSLFAVGSSVDAAYQSYLTLVVAGSLPTNDVPRISNQYREFQAVFNTALTLATLNSNALASGEVLSAANKFNLAINAEKGKSK